MMLFNNRAQLRNFRGGIQASGGRFWLSAGGASEIETGCEGSANSGTRAAPQEFVLGKLPNVGAQPGADIPAEGFDDLSDMHKVSAP